MIRTVVFSFKEFIMYGVLKSSQNTGLDTELQYVFATPLLVKSNQPAYVSDTLSLKRKVNSQNVQRWEIEAEIVPTNDSPNVLIHTTKNGFSEVFFIRMPQVYTPVKIRQTSILSLTNTVFKGATQLNITDLGSLDLTGQFINFEGNSKVYLVTYKGVNGVGVEITPPLLTNFAQDTKIIYGDKVTMHARYDIDTQLGITYTDGVLSSPGTFKFVEAL